MEKNILIKKLNDYLKISEFEDSSKNWLQVDTEKIEINKIWYAVDATSYIFDKAIYNGVDMVVVHHWMYWWSESALTNIHFQRANKLIKNNIWLYACHLPLDAHDEVWNNIWIIKWFTNIYWIKEYKLEKFWNYHWTDIWFGIKFEEKIHISTIISMLCHLLQLEKKLYNFWNKEYISSMCVISWWWADWIFEAKSKWYDLFITWEAKHSDLINSKEIWQSILLWWHRETEKIWVKLLANYITKTFWIETIFLDEKY